MEMQARTLAQKGFNGYRAGFAPYCTDSNGFFGTYNASQLHRSIEIAAHFGLWIIVDYHGYDDLQTATSTSCWLSFWDGVVQRFTGSYDRIIWEPLNEPNATLTTLSIVSFAYQQWVNQARSKGDAHWIVIENLCSFSCRLPIGDYWKAYPTISDPADRLFISLHTYFEYRYHYDNWSNQTADTYANMLVQDMIEGSVSTQRPVLNTEGGPGRPFGRLTNGTMITCPDLILNGSSGYCKTNFHFIQTLTNLLDNQATTLQPRFNWLWFPVADWSSSIGAGIYGSLSPSGPGWGTLLSYKNPPPLLNLSVSATPKSLTIYPGSSKISLIAVNSTGFAGATTLATIATPSGPVASPSSSLLQITAGGGNTTTLTVNVPAGTPVGAYDVRVTSSAGTLGSRATIIRVVVRDFTIETDSEIARLLAGQDEVSRIALGGLNDFNDSIALSATTSPSASNVTLFPAIVTVRPGQTSTATLSFNTTVAGIYTLTITGRTEGASHSANVTLIVQDFKISLDLPDSPIQAGYNPTITLSVSGIDGFSGNVTLVARVSPNGPTVELTPGAVALGPGGTGNATLTIDLPSTVPAGTYNIIIDATGSGIHHQTVVPFTVTHPARASPFTILGFQLLPFVAFVSFASLTIAAGIIVAYKKLYLSRKNSAQTVRLTSKKCAGRESRPVIAVSKSYLRENLAGRLCLPNPATLAL
jgi:hypothetical protein